MEASPTERLLRLLSVLQTGREYTGVELADRLGVSIRTIRRDIGRLRDLGYPVDASIGAIGGYRLVAGTAMPPLLLDDDEAVAIAVGLQTAATGMDEPAARALAKIEQVLPGRLRRRVEAVTAATEPLTGMLRGGNPVAPAVDPEVFAALATACRRGQRLRFTYAAKGGAEPARRHADPHRLVSADRRWYLVAYDLDRLDWRTFRADRVGAPEATGAPATEREPPGGDAATFVAESITGIRARHRALVVLHTGIEDARARLPGGTGVLEEIDERSCLLTTGGDALDWLAMRLVLLDVPLEVREPPELAAYMRRLGRRMIEAGSSRSART
ncbi:helix-turn-helix transcriptional regulator [Phytomonospora endophytica]|uniref:Putative DNA-binding transcriptional regulator YafY n=1 Tax=Phytomonospora endophytica TaxID=714109 RepID=A0A841FMK7_9ACTN|nr:YafY family protein [Phytomonospora endophytica]MBB6034782.1 putative DNA-binding transcriptional regulator YafY [Phytomonospora endophytica]GIG69015.1 DNA-binding transcriptional regulator [Phytomonospora endophytica]